MLRPRPLALAASLLLVVALILVPAREIGATSQFDYVADYYADQAYASCFEAWDWTTGSDYDTLWYAYYGTACADYAYFYEYEDPDYFYLAAYFFVYACVYAWDAAGENADSHGNLDPDWLAASDSCYYAAFYCYYAYLYSY